MHISKKILAVAAGSALALTMASCGGGDAGSTTGDTLNIGIKYDQPGLGQKVGEDYKGLDVDVARYVANPDGASCEFALVVADGWQRKGLGRRMMEQLIDVARARGLKAMVGHVLAENRGMLSLCQKLGFVVADSDEGPMVKRVTLALD